VERGKTWRRNTSRREVLETTGEGKNRGEKTSDFTHLEPARAKGTPLNLESKRAGKIYGTAGVWERGENRKKMRTDSASLGRIDKIWGQKKGRGNLWEFTKKGARDKKQKKGEEWNALGTKKRNMHKVAQPGVGRKKEE